MSSNSSRTQALLGHMNTCWLLSLRLDSCSGVRNWDMFRLEQDGAESAEKTDQAVLIGKSKTKRAPPATDQCEALVWRGGSRSRCDNKCKGNPAAGGDKLCSTHVRQRNIRGNLSEDQAVRYDPVKKTHFYNGTVAGTVTQNGTNNDWFRVIHHGDDATSSPDIMILQGFCLDDVGTGFATDEMIELGGDGAEYAFGHGDFKSKYAFLKKCYPDAHWMTLKGRYGNRHPALKAIFEELNLTVGRPTHEWCLEHTDKL